MTQLVFALVVTMGGQTISTEYWSSIDTCLCYAKRLNSQHHPHGYHRHSITEREHLHAKCPPRRFEPLSISADFDCDVDAESDDQQLAVVEVEGSTFAKVTLEGVLLALRKRSRSWGAGLDSV